VVLLLAFTLGTLIAQNAVKRQKVSGEFIAELYQTEDRGNWKVIDRMRATANFEATAFQATAQTDFVWHGRSEQGCQLSARWGGGARYRVDIHNGLLEFEVPIELNVNGNTVTVPVKCTTGSVNTPFSTLSGQRAAIKDGAVSATVVGIGSFRTRRLHFDCSDSGSGKRGNAPDSSNDEFLLVLKGEGRVAPLD
jgi:hypothetical protein